MTMKDVTPRRGAQTKAQEKKATATAPRFRSDGPQNRSKGGRGNERVTNDDVARTAEQATTSRWDRLPNALEYLRRFIDATANEPVPREEMGVVIKLLVEGLRRYVEGLEARARNKEAMDPERAMRTMDEAKHFKEYIGEMVKSPAEKIFDILRFTVVPEVFIDREITALSLEGIGRCNIQDDISVVMQGETKDEKDHSKALFQQWLIANGKEDLITATVNAQTLAAFVRSQIKDKNGLKLPMDLIEIKPVTRAVITSA